MTTVAKAFEYHEERVRAFQVFNTIVKYNPNTGLSVEMTKDDKGSWIMYIHGNVEGESLKLPNNWHFSKNEGEIIGTPFLIGYSKKIYKHSELYN